MCFCENFQNPGHTSSSAPHRVVWGPLAGHMVLDFAAPWGSHMQLVGRDVPDPGSTGLAAANIQYDGD